MIIDHLSTALQGGAGIAAARLHLSLREAGVESRLWCKRPKRGQTLHLEGAATIEWPLDGAAPTWASRMAMWLRRRQARWRLKRALRGRPPGCELFSTARRERPTPYDDQVFHGDVLHLHWVSHFIDWPSFFASVPPNLPIVWTLHDMHSFTGGCHHADDCRAFVTACQHCPQLGRRGERDLAAVGFADKSTAYRGKPLHIVTPSRWMEAAARRSALFFSAASVRTIPHGLDIHLFAPVDKQAARQQLGIRPSGIVVAFGAAALAHPRKGLPDLLSALTVLQPKRDIVGLTFGDGDLPATGACFAEVKHLKYIADPRLQSVVYSAADLFVVPSHAESFGLTGLEAMACGTAVVAFEAGGVTDYVRPGQTGLLARLRDRADLARQIGWMLEHPDARRQMGSQAREMVVREFNQRSLTRRYLDLYEEALAAAGGAGKLRVA